MNIPTKAMSCSMPLRLMIHYCFRDDFSHRRSGCQTVADKKSSNVHSQLVTTDMNTRKVLKRNKAKLNVHFANSLYLNCSMLLVPHDCQTARDDSLSENIKQISLHLNIC